jgi:hypothetical protein
MASYRFSMLEKGQVVVHRAQDLREREFIVLRRSESLRNEPLKGLKCMLVLRTSRAKYV